MQNPSGNLDVSVWRGNVAGGGYSAYLVPIQENQTILDVVTWIQHRLEPTLSYRFACRVGMCGSCAMMVNGKPRWTCRAHVQRVIDGNSLKIAPLRNLPVIKDLVCDMAEFFAKWRKAEGHFHPTSTRHEAIAPIPPDDPRRIAASAAIECINCAVCYAACDVVALNPDYLGPAAPNRAWPGHATPASLCQLVSSQHYTRTGSLLRPFFFMRDLLTCSMATAIGFIPSRF